MGSSYFTNPLEFLISTLIGLYITAVMLRFLLAMVRADFYNPLTQILVKLTNPALKPLRRFIPGFGGIDIASLLLMLALQMLALALITLLRGVSLHPVGLLLWAIAELLGLLLNIYMFSILIQVVLSWINPGGYNPAVSLIYSINEPLLAPARRLIPPLSGLDLSPVVVLLGLQLAKMLLLPPLLTWGQALG
jgi:YggT family protein